MSARILLACGLVLSAPLAAAQDPAAARQASSAAADDMSQMDHSQMDHSQMDHSQMDHSQMDHSRMDHSQMDHSSSAPRTPIPPVTADDLAAAFPTLHGSHAHAGAPVHYLLVDRLEGWDRDAGSGQAWEVNGWYGGDIHRLRLRSEGEREDGRTHSADAELLYGRAISPWWELVAGVRQDFAPGASRTRAAFGIQGLAPYKFELSATAYIGDGSDAALRVEGEYTLLLTSRWILQPRLEANVSAHEDAQRGEGGGLDSASVGLRLRYEISRRFAPYIGWEHERRFGDAARLAEADGEASRASRFVAGVRFWF
ncbi:copper resistance protein B [Stenotrophomonas panacihumi]|uniref:copper resistance protein B n=1 Tax=Stenotrophomonas panacihumi TaxID=676599 RepID=UPI000D3BB7A1|nr:copper resistance protein B [Stenotrophomonas panacihumi]PTN55390.1 copper resistance protein CopB [Stenotrophomonas panacihumi]